MVTKVGKYSRFHISIFSITVRYFCCVLFNYRSRRGWKRKSGLWLHKPKHKKPRSLVASVPVQEQNTPCNSTESMKPAPESLLHAPFKTNKTSRAKRRKKLFSESAREILTRKRTDRALNIDVTGDFVFLLNDF